MRGGSGGWYLAVASGQSSFFGPVASFIGGMDQVYFMSLFFFISGVFVPNTFDKAMHVKKTGRLGFLSDKFYRLGVPFVCYLYGFGPLLDCFVARVAVAARLRNRVQMFLPGADGGLDGFLRPVRTQVRFDFHLFGGR